MGYNKYLGIENWSSDGKHIIQIFTFIRLGTDFIESLTNTFLFLYIMDALGFEKASIIITIIFASQLATDYPTGSLGDKLGHRWILGFAIFLYSIAFFLLTNATSYLLFIVIALIYGFANAQASGALQSWFDNNYQKLNIEIDPEKKNYGYSMNRINALDSFVFGFGIISGGILATQFSRSFVFMIDGFLSIILSILIIQLMKDIKPNSLLINLKDPIKKTLTGILSGGLEFVFSDISTFLFVLGFAIYQFVWLIWGNIILFPIYFSYTGSDNTMGLMRSAIYFMGMIIAIIISNLTKRINIKEMNLYLGGQSIVLFGGTIFLLHFFKPKNQFNLIGVIIIVILFTFSTAFLGRIGNLLSQRFILNLIPSEFRNSLYSFIPTISGILALIFLPFTGIIVQNYGMSAGVLICSLFSIIGLVMMEISLRIINGCKIIKFKSKKICKSYS